MPAGFAGFTWGHWNDAYQYVRLHQPSLLYGVSSKKLEGEGTGPPDLQHRATKQQILDYYADVVTKWQEEGLVKFFGGLEFNREKAKTVLAQGAAQAGADVGAGRLFDFEFARVEDDRLQRDNARRVPVPVSLSIREKLVDATAGECIVPSAENMSWFFKVEDPKIQVLVPSELHELEESDFHHKRFVVLGGGKTGMDALVWLQRAKKVESGRISWVVGKETWMLNREKPASAGVLADTVLDEFGANETGYLETALDKLVDQGRLLMVGEEGEPRPTEFRFPIIDSEELSYLREVTRYQGYVEKLELVIDPAPTKDDGGAKPKEDEGSVRIHFKEKMNSEQGAKMSDEEKPVTVGKAKDVVFIHCTAPGPFFNINRKPPPLYEGSHQMNLKNISPPPVPQSASTLAWIETGRRLNADPGEYGALRNSMKKILVGKRAGKKAAADMSPEESLTELIRPGLGAPPENFGHVWNMGVLYSLDFGFDKFPLYRTFSDSNRLMAIGPPGTKRQHDLETMEKLAACMTKRGSAMTIETNGIDGEKDFDAVQAMVKIMTEKELRDN
eukprot:g14601.t1